MKRKLRIIIGMSAVPALAVMVLAGCGDRSSSSQSDSGSNPGGNEATSSAPNPGQTTDSPTPSAPRKMIDAGIGAVTNAPPDTNSIKTNNPPGANQ